MQCSNCNKEIADGSRFCGFCGTEQSATKKCASCGREIEGQPSFCPYCGTSVAGQPVQAAQTSQPVPPIPAPHYQQPVSTTVNTEITKEATVGVGLTRKRWGKMKPSGHATGPALPNRIKLLRQQLRLLAGAGRVTGSPCRIFLTTSVVTNWK